MTEDEIREKLRSALTIDGDTSLADSLGLGFIPRSFSVIFCSDSKVVQFMYGVKAIKPSSAKPPTSEEVQDKPKPQSKEEKTKCLCFICVTKGDCHQKPVPFPDGFTKLSVPAMNTTMDLLHMILAMARHNLNLVAHAAVSCGIDIEEILQHDDEWRKMGFPTVSADVKSLKKSQLMLNGTHPKEVPNTGSLPKVTLDGNIQASKFDEFSTALRTIAVKILRILETQMTEQPKTPTQQKKAAPRKKINLKKKTDLSQDPRSYGEDTKLQGRLNEAEELINNGKFRFSGTSRDVKRPDVDKTLIKELHFKLFERIPEMLDTVTELVHNMAMDFSTNGHLEKVQGLVTKLITQRDEIYVDPTFPLYLHLLKDHLVDMVKALPASCKSFKMFQNQGTEAAHSAHKKTFCRVKDKCAFQLHCRWLENLMACNMFPHLLDRLTHNHKYLPPLYKDPDVGTDQVPLPYAKHEGLLETGEECESEDDSAADEYDTAVDAEYYSDVDEYDSDADESDSDVEYGTAFDAEYYLDVGENESDSDELTLGLSKKRGHDQMSTSNRGATLDPPPSKKPKIAGSSLKSH